MAVKTQRAGCRLSAGLGKTTKLFCGGSVTRAKWKHCTLCRFRWKWLSKNITFIILEVPLVRHRCNLSFYESRNIEVFLYKEPIYSIASPYFSRVIRFPSPTRGEFLPRRGLTPFFTPLLSQYEPPNTHTHTHGSHPSKHLLQLIKLTFKIQTEE